MAIQVKRLKNLSLIAAALVITLTAALTFAAEEITLTTIMPGQDTLRVKRGAVGLTYKGKTDGEIGDDNLIIEGKVGIGTTAPGAKLHVSGDGDTILVPVKSTTTDPSGSNGMIYYNGALGKFRVYENGEWKDLAAAGEFGSWTNVDSASNPLIKATIYKATSDGFIAAVGPTYNSGPISIMTDSDTSPATIRCRQTGYHTTDASKATSGFSPVRKNDYWKVTLPTGAPTIYWLPIGSGTCEIQ